MELMLKEIPRYECLLEGAKRHPELDPSAMEAFLHLLRTSTDVYETIGRMLAGHAISKGRFMVLVLLNRDPDRPVSPADLADGSNVTRATMTGLIDTLERDGFVKRVPDPEDRRMLSVTLTPKAERFLAGLLPGHFKLMAALARTLSERERQTLVGLLNKIIEQAAALAGAPRPAVAVAR